MVEGLVIKHQCLMFVSGSIKGIENLHINDVATELEVGNASDDDVIEVVRDDAPIEILSDGEEMELEKTKQNTMLDSIVENFHFTSLPADPPVESNVTSEHNDTIDPLTNSEAQPSCALSSCTLQPFDNIGAVHSTTDSNYDEKYNQDDNEENHYVNVTDLDTSDNWSTMVQVGYAELESWSPLITSVNQLDCDQSDDKKTKENAGTPPPLPQNTEQPEQTVPTPDEGKTFVDNPPPDVPLAEVASVETPAVENPPAPAAQVDNTDDLVPKDKTSDIVDENK